MPDRLKVLRKKAEHLPDGAARAARPGVAPVEAQLSARRLQRQDQDRQERRLPRPIRPEQPEHPLAERQVDPVQRLMPVGIDLPDPVQLDEV